MSDETIKEVERDDWQPIIPQGSLVYRTFPNDFNGSTQFYTFPAGSPAYQSFELPSSVADRATLRALCQLIIRSLDLTDREEQ